MFYSTVMPILGVGRKSREPTFVFLMEELGLPGEDIIRNSAYLGQMALAVNIDEDLRRQISGAGKADYKSAREYLKNQYYSLTKFALEGERNRSGERKIEDLENSLVALKNQLRQAHGIAENFSSNAAEVDQLNKEKEDIDIHAAQLQEEIKNLDKYLKLCERKGDISQRAILEQRQLDQIKDLRDEIKKISVELASDQFSLIESMINENRKLLRQYLNSRHGGNTRRNW